MVRGGRSFREENVMLSTVYTRLSIIIAGSLVLLFVLLASKLSVLGSLLNSLFFIIVAIGTDSDFLVELRKWKQAKEEGSG